MIAWTLYIFGVYLMAKVSWQVAKDAGKDVPFWFHLVTGAVWPVLTGAAMIHSAFLWTDHLTRT